MISFLHSKERTREVKSVIKLPLHVKAQGVDQFHEKSFIFWIKTRLLCIGNVIYQYFSHYHYFSHFESKGASPLPHADDVNTEDDQKFSPSRS